MIVHLVSKRAKDTFFFFFEARAKDTYHSTFQIMPNVITDVTNGEGMVINLKIIVPSVN